MKGLSRESRALIDAARDGDEPSGADRKRVRAALGRKLAVGAAAGAVAIVTSNSAAGGFAAAGTTGGAAAATGVGAGVAVGAASGTAATVGAVATGATAVGFGAKLLVSVALVGAIGAGGAGYVRHEASKRASAARVVEALRSRPAAAPVVAAVVAPQQRTQAPVPPEATAEAPAPSAPLPAVARPATTIARAPESPAATAAASPSSLDLEVALLQEAHVALQMNDGARALRLLDERARTFPSGALSEEAAAARVFALVQLGRVEEARDVAERFLREHPRSPLAPRVSRAVESGATTF